MCISGKNKGQQGKVMKVFRKKNKVLVQGVNLQYKMVEDDEGVRRKKVAQIEAPLHVSNVSLIDPETSLPTRIRYGYLKDSPKTKVRLSVRSGAVIDKPDRSDMKYINRTKSKEAGDNDTKPDDVLTKTYTGEDYLKIYHEFQEYIHMKEQQEKLLVFDK